MTPEGSSRQQDTAPTHHRADLAGWALWLLAALCAISVAGALSLMQVEQSDHILRGVEALGVDLGGMSKTQAAAALQRVWDQRTIEIVAEEVVRHHTPTELGILLDGAAMADSAHALGRQPGHMEAILRQQPPVSVPPMWRVDPAVSESVLKALAREFDRPRRDATIRQSGAHVEAVAAEAGRALHVTESVAWLRQHAAELLAQQRWELPVIPLPPVIGDVSGAAAEARELLAHSLSLRLTDPIADETSIWTIAPSVWSAWLQLGLEGQQPATLRWELNTAKMEDDLRERMAERDPKRFLDMSAAVPAVTKSITGGSWQTQLRLYHQPDQHTVQEGETLASIAFDRGIPYPWIQEANRGVTDTIRVGQVLEIPSPDTLLPLPVVEGKRITVSLSSQKMWAYEGGSLKWEWSVSTGMPSSPTSPGVFQVQSHEPEAYAAEWDLLMPHFMGIYEPGPHAEVMNGFHGFPSRGGAQILWTNSLGRRVTYGCILLSTDNAARLYEWAEDGTVVVIRP